MFEKLIERCEYFFDRTINFDILWIAHDGQFRFDWCILSDDRIVWLAVAIRRNATTIKRLCFIVAVYCTNDFGNWKFFLIFLFWSNRSTIQSHFIPIGPKYLIKRYADNKSKCVQRFYCYISVDCGILLFMFSRFTKKQIDSFHM